MWCVISWLVVSGIVVLISVLMKSASADVRVVETAEVEQADAQAENGNHEAQYDRGEYYITRDLEKAKYWFSKAKEHGSSKAHDRLKIVTTAILEKATRISKNGKGKEHYNKMMELSSEPSTWTGIGEYYRNGFVWLNDDNTIYLIDGLEVNKATAVYWLKKAADHGIADGVWRLGTCYLYGEGVEKNVKHGLQLIHQAAEMGSNGAKKELANPFIKWQESLTK